MSKCLNCNKDVPQIKGKKAKQFCNDACRMAFKRKSEHLKSEQIKSEQVKSEQNIKSEQPEQTDPNKQPEQKFQTTSGYPYKKTDKMVYGRRGVIYPHEANGVINSSGAEWTTRPEPKNLDDIPNLDNRNCYKRKDGSEYWIGTSGEI